jgi:hypothetical protein
MKENKNKKKVISKFSFEFVSHCIGSQNRREKHSKEKGKIPSETS